MTTLNPRFFDYVKLNFPSANFRTDVVVSIDQDGDATIEWNLPGKAPTDADIAAANPPKWLPPDPVGFLEAAKSAMGGILGALALGHYATLLWDAVGNQNWADASTLIQAAQTNSVITPQQYAGLKQLAAQYNIPVVLP